MKKVLTIQDISCFGKCSLTVALPIISSMGLETAIIPTAVLSTHTGGFEGYTFRDLTEDITGIINHWKKVPLTFETVYSGYLGSYEQIDILCDIFHDFAAHSLKVVDPVMGDKGELYAGFDNRFALKMRDLCARADVIVPNLTEACAMLGVDYREDYDAEYINGILIGLRETGAKNTVLTGVTLERDKIGAAVLAQGSDEAEYVCTDHLPASYPGTGDVFASTLTGALTKGLPLTDAARIAVDFTWECIRNTMPDSSYTYSVKFEECLPSLIKKVNA
ncbi:MAG: pyridoxamine kinase [Clostridia bacterium]|nr:pyridoxamine kinase [Clostridia bacterium]